jgi:flagellar basal body-associated protein FliL
MAKKKANQKKMSRSQKIMAIIGVFIILSMVVGSIASLLTTF